MTEMLGYVKESKLEDLSEFLAKEFRKLEKAGADFGAMASNTPHIVFEDVQKKINIPLLSIVEETLKEIGMRNIDKAGLFGTLSTMEDSFKVQGGNIQSKL
jgi:aspartate racemase